MTRSPSEQGVDPQYGLSCCVGSSGASTVLVQSVDPVLRSRQSRLRFRPLSAATVTKTRPRDTMGLLLPVPSIAVRQRMFFCGPHSTGVSGPTALADPDGPRNWGQSTARTAEVLRRRASRASGIMGAG